jgi:molybdopterin molybdotransferase
MLRPEEAWKRIEAENPAPLPGHKMPRREALWRILAEALPAEVDQPMADVSAMDGYALAGPVPDGTSLPVAGVAAAGRPAEVAAGPGRAIKIMTGAILPEGADRVVIVENTDGGKDAVRIDKAPAAGENIRPRGEIVRRGEVLLPAGSLLTPGALSLAAGHGHGEVVVNRPPRVAMLTTGDEIVAPEEEPGPGQLRDSNTVFLAAAGLSLGLEFEHLGIARDDRADLQLRIAKGLKADVLLLCGGVSKGDFDYVEEVLETLGCRRLFDAVAIQPGKPLVAARHESGTWVLGLPGNPASVMTCFWLFGRPLLRRLMGLADGFWQGALEAELKSPAAGSRQRDRYLPATVEAENGRLYADPQPPKGSHDVSTFARGTALLRVPAGVAKLERGDRCEVLPLASWPLA